MEWEFEWLYTLQTIHNSFLDALMVFITSLGNAGIVWIVIALCFCFSKKYRTCGIQMFVSMIFVLFIGNLVLKNLIARDRPCWIDPDVALLVKNPSDFSFPSGHSMNSFTSAVTILFYNKKAGAAAVALASVIAFSRLYHFVHFPTDVFAGILLGTGVALAVNYVSRKYSVASLLSRLKKKS